MDVYIIIVTYNGMKWLEKCLDSCKAFKVVVIDNASSDETLDFIKTNYTSVHIIESDKNLGFGKANNIGISYALSQNAKSVFLLNQDAYLVGDVLPKLYKFQREHLNYGIISPVHVNGTGDALDYNFSNYVSNTKNPYFYSDHVTETNLKPVYDVPFVNAAAWLISRECLEKIGGFDPLFFHYSEDNNFCQRVLYHGFKIGVVPKAFIIHDRKQVKHKKMIAYSPEFYQWKERWYKTKFADVNLDNPLDSINQELSEIKKAIIKGCIKLDFKMAKGALRQQNKLKNLLQEILKSYNTNKTEGAHYL